MRNYIPTSVTFDLQAYFNRFRVFSREHKLDNCNPRVFQGYPNLETFVQCKVFEALLFIRTALPETKILVDVGSYLQLAEHLQVAKTKLKVMYGVSLGN